MEFLIINGKVLRKEEANLTHLFWDEPFILSQKIWFGFGGIPLFNKNIDFLTQQLNVFNISVPGFLKNKRELFRITKRMLNKNKFYRSGIINIQLFIIDTKIDYVITSIGYPEFDFLFSKHGLHVNFSESKRRSANDLNRHLFYNKTNWRIKQSQLRDSTFNNSILINEKGMISEGIGSNIFMIKENVLITPSLGSGCFEDTIRNIILETAPLLQLKTIELSNIKKEHIFEMNEIFFASEETGIQWILGVENKRFVNPVTKQIHQKLNDILKKKVIDGD
ncbi:MAG: aminotransferase class IV [Draconibacterium sp.]|nr:aminotransferase class IV [Draconibacterium sp.]